MTMKCGANLNTTGGILSPASGLTAQQVVLTLQLEKGLLLVVSIRIAPGCATFPGRGKATLTWFDGQNIQTATCWAGGFAHRGYWLEGEVCGGKKNASPSLFFSLKKYKQEKRRTSLKALAGSDEIDKSVSRVSPQLDKSPILEPQIREDFRTLSLTTFAFVKRCWRTGLQPSGTASSSPPVVAYKVGVEGGKRAALSAPSGAEPVEGQERIKFRIFWQVNARKSRDRDVTLWCAFLK